MKTATALGITLLLGTGIGVAQDKAKQGKGPAGPGLTLTTTGFADGSEIPTKFTMSAPDGNGCLVSSNGRMFQPAP